MHFPLKIIYHCGDGQLPAEAEKLLTPVLGEVVWQRVRVHPLQERAEHVVVKACVDHSVRCHGNELRSVRSAIAAGRGPHGTFS